MALLRPRLATHHFLSSSELRAHPNGQMMRACGLVTLRQQPQAAGGTIFVSLEDEECAIQVIVWKRVREKQRQVLLESRLLGIYGEWQRDRDVHNLIAHRLVDLSRWLGRLAVSSRNFK